MKLNTPFKRFLFIILLVVIVMTVAQIAEARHKRKVCDNQPCGVMVGGTGEFVGNGTGDFMPVNWPN